MIHKFSSGGYNICLDVCSGAVHVLDDCAFALLDYSSEQMDEKFPEAARKALGLLYDERELQECWDELYTLYKDGTLHSEDVFEPYADKLIGASLKSMCLNISHDCNLACEYCFAQKGGFGGKRMLMSEETARKAIDFLVARSYGRHNLELDFFGGEPLMNLDVVKKTVEYARSLEEKHNKRFRFTITTNGLLLDDDATDFINREMSNCVLSIDGRKEVNDRLRIDWGGKGSYDRIIDKYKKLVAKRGEKDYYIRATYSSYNLDFAEDVLHLYSLGFKNLSEEPVVTDEKLDYAIREEHMPRIMEEYERLAEKIIELKNRGEDILFFHYMIDLDAGPCAIRRLRGCSSGNEYVCVCPDGSVYPCHSFVGMENWLMGSVLDNSLSEEIRSRFQKTSVYSKPECRECWARFHCSGGCSAINFEMNGDILKTYPIYCQMQKKRLECALYIKAALADD